MSGLVFLAVAASASLVAQGMRLRERVPQDVLASFSRQENVNVCLFKLDPLARRSGKYLKPGALVLTWERLLVYMPPESLLPSCRPLSWDELKEAYFPGRHFMYNHNGVLEEARFESLGTTRVVEGAIVEQRTIQYTPSNSLSVQEAQYDFGIFYPLDGERLLTYKSELCAYPEEAASIAIETIAMWPVPCKQNTDQCYVISGCPDDECKESRVEWTGDFGFNDVLSLPFRNAIVDAHLQKNEISELLGPAIRFALRFRGSAFADHPDFDQADFSEIATAFSQGIIPKKDDPNSRSGAAFFYSVDKKYIAKRIRECEYKDGLLALEAGGKYSQHIRGGSTLCPTYIGFQSMGANWIVMRREQVPPDIKELLYSTTQNIADNITDVRSFFTDIKPRPMVSDRLKCHSMFGKEFLERGFQLADLHGWSDILEIVDMDVQFLQAAKLVDYSFWIYGILFDLPLMHQKDGWEKSMFDIIWGRDIASGKPGSQRRHPGCVYGCQNSRPTPLVDLTRTMGKVQNRLQMFDATYKCCCAELSATTFKPASPCVLVDMNKAGGQLTIAFNRTGCENLLGRGWHSYYHQTVSPTNGKCLVGLGTQTVWTDLPHIDQNLIFPEQLGYTARGPEVVSDLPWRCGVVCVSIGDYFLRLGAWENFENMALTLWYREQKWTDYPKKMNDLLQGLQGRPPFSNDFVDAISGSMPLALENRVELSA